MFHYVFKRIAVMIPTLLVISFIIFVIIQLPPGDYLETYIAELESQGESVDREKIEFLRHQYGLDQPFLVQYYDWASGFFRGDWGYSFEHDLPVREVVGDRIWLTIIVSMVTILFTWLLAFPIGIYSATHQYSWGDYGLTGKARGLPPAQPTILICFEPAGILESPLTLTELRTCKWLLP